MRYANTNNINQSVEGERRGKEVMFGKPPSQTTADIPTSDLTCKPRLVSLLPLQTQATAFGGYKWTCTGSDGPS